MELLFYPRLLPMGRWAESTDVNWTEEFRRGWWGTSQPSPLFSAAFAASCIALSTSARWGLSLIRPDVPFTPYLPAVFFATAFGGLRTGIATAIVGGLLAETIDFGESPAGSAKLALLAIYITVCSLTIWGVQHYRSVVSHHREISKRLIAEEEYRKLVIDELQHRLKNKLSTIHAVLHQVLRDQPHVWSTIDQRIRALSATDELIARADGGGCDIKDLLQSELGPYDHVRFTLNGGPLFLPSQLAVSLALIFHELATNAGKYGAFSSARGLLQVSWSVADDRLTIVWDETEGPAIERLGRAGFGTKLLNSALKAFDGRTEIAYLKTGLHCILQCRIPRE